MKTYVIDTSVVARIFIEKSPFRENALRVFKLADEEKIKLIAPTLIVYELNNALIKAGLSVKHVSDHMNVFLMQTKGGIPSLIPHSFKLIEQVIKNSSVNTQGKGHISSYDMTFHSLALMKKCEFLTADEKHYRKVEGIFDSVVLLSDFE